jgi:pilus assembly protein CpaE
MGQALQFIVMNSDEGFRKELRDAVRACGSIKIVAEVQESALLRQAVTQFSADVLVVNLDPDPDAVLPIAAEVAAATPELAVFAASSASDSQLILKAMRSGMKEVLPRPFEVGAISEAIARVSSARTETARRGTLITVSSPSGGSGATVLATNLAVELAQIASGRVTVVDLDYRYGQVATLLDVEPSYTLADLCNSPEQLEQQVIDRALVKHETGLYVLARPALFEQADTITASSCVGLLSTLLQFNEYVVTDGPSRFDIGAPSVLAFSDFNVLLVQPVVPAIRSAARAIDSMKEVGTNLEHLRLVCNRAGRETGYVSLDDVKETLGITPFAVIPSDWGPVSSAINLGEPLLTQSPKSKIRLAIAELAERLHTPQVHTDDNGERKKGLIGRIFATT